MPSQSIVNLYKSSLASFWGQGKGVERGISSLLGQPGMEAVSFEGEKRGKSLLTKRERCVILPRLRPSQSREARQGVAGGVDGLRESLARDESLDLLLVLGGPEQLKSGKQNKQQLLLGWWFVRAIIRAGSFRHTACDTELSANKQASSSCQFSSISPLTKGEDGPQSANSQVFYNK
jgi:hypothetical protein